MNPENLTLLEAENLPVGSVIEESGETEGGTPAALTKRDDDKWTCELCEDPHALSTIFRSLLTYSLKSLGELSEGFVFRPADLELTKFAPEGTLVVDRDDDGGVWEKIGENWFHGVSHEDRLKEAETWKNTWVGALNPAWAPYMVVSKDEAEGYDEPFQIQDSDGKLSAVEAEKLTDKVLCDSAGDLWRMIDGKWQFSVGGVVFSLFLGYRSDGLPPMFAPYEVVKTEGLTVEDLLESPDRLYFDADGDLWGCRDGMWSWGIGLGALDRKMSGGLFLHDEPFRDSGPYRLAEGVSLPKPDTEPEPEPEEGRAPTSTEIWRSISVSLDRIANALENK